MRAASSAVSTESYSSIGFFDTIRKHGGGSFIDDRTLCLIPIYFASAPSDLSYPKRIRMPEEGEGALVNGRDIEVVDLQQLTCFHLAAMFLGVDDWRKPWAP